MEHIERAGVHSGDSMAVYPPRHLNEKIKQLLCKYSEEIVLNIGAIGITNIQFVLPPQQNDEEPKIFVIEVNPRASRTVPFLSKVTGVPMVQIAVQAMLGRSISEQGWPTGLWAERNLVAIKAPVFSMSKLPEVDTYLGPEMKSTGEVMGIDFSYEAALTKALLASGNDLQPGIPILLSLSERTKEEALGLVRNLQAAQCPLYATCLLYTSAAADE